MALPEIRGYERMSIQFSDLARQVKADGRVSAEEIRELRQLGWGDGKIYREEAEAIFTINNAVSDPSPEWVDFFVEALSEFVLNGTEPRGMCDDDEAAWLMDSIDHDGRVESMAELELLVRVVEKARNVPFDLKQYAVRQIEREVLRGTGPTRCGGQLSDVHITEAEVKLLRRLVFASGGHGPAAVTRFDAEMLFRIKDETNGEANHASWDDLFVDAVANYLKGFQLSNAQISHERMKELEAFIADNKVRVGRVIGGMIREMPNVANHFGQVFGKKPSGMDYAEAAAAGNIVDDNESAWLEKMIDADGEVDDLERKLIVRIAAKD